MHRVGPQLPRADQRAAKEVMQVRASARASSPQLLARPQRVAIRGGDCSSAQRRRAPGPAAAAAASGGSQRGPGPVHAQATVPQPLVAQKCSPCEPADPLEFMGFCTVSGSEAMIRWPAPQAVEVLRFECRCRHRLKDTTVAWPGLLCSAWIAAPRRPTCSRCGRAVLPFGFGLRMYRNGAAP